MRSFSPFFALCALVLGPACGPLVTAGTPCTTRAECNPSFSCFLKPAGGSVDIPGGFCSRGCSAEGNNSECPSGTVCSYFGDGQLVCAPQCTTSANCREGYTCVDVGNGNQAIGSSGAGQKSCRPAAVTR